MSHSLTTHRPFARRPARVKAGALILAALVCLSVAAAPPPPTPTIQPAAAAPALAGIDAFSPVSANAGWLLSGQHLYWTQSAGQSWADITPPDLAGLAIQAVTFLDVNTGWAVLAGAGADGEPQYRLMRTLDGGRVWQPFDLALFAPGDDAAQASKVFLQFIDAQTGWLVVRQASSSNFSRGTLFATRDGGQTWRRLDIPIGEPVAFVTPEVGWTAGGAAGSELYNTLDGGQTWQTVTPGVPSAAQGLYELPVFTDAQSGVLPVLVPAGDRSRLELLATTDGGLTWQPSAQVALDQPASPGVELPLAVFDAAHWSLLEPSGQGLVRRSGQAQTNQAPRIPSAGTLGALKMVSPDSGWALQTFDECTPQTVGSSSSGQCDREVRLLQTGDGGQSWITLPLPAGLAVSGSSIFSNQTGPVTAPGGISPQGMWSSVLLLTGQGFDTCTVPTAAQLQTWISKGPYKAVNLYIGGSLRACPNPLLNAALLSQLKQQGWTFIPTWVGPQAACTSYGSRISYDLTAAYNQGVSEANAATNAVATLGLTLADKSGSVIYYDLEAYGGTGASQACRDSAKSFMSGWTSQLHARGNLSGVYGGACSSALSDFAGAANVPDAVWVASWLSSPQYHADATVLDIPCLSNVLWKTHQRLRQYTYGHAETWGGVSLQIDSNVVDGPVASSIDVTPPTATTTIKPLYKNSPFRDFSVVMSATDTQTGVASYDLQYRDGPSGTWVDAVTKTTNPTYPFAGVEGHTYTFHVRARDNAGNLSAYMGESQYTVPLAQPVAADSFEPDNTPAAAQPFVLGETQTHNFNAAGDTDWVRLTAQANQVYLVWTSNIGGFADTVVELYAPDGTTLLALNDDDPANWPSSRLAWRAPAAGTYYLKVHHFDVYAFGLTTRYGLSITQLSNPVYAPVIFGSPPAAP